MVQKNMTFLSLINGRGEIEEMDVPVRMQKTEITANMAAVLYASGKEPAAASGSVSEIEKFVEQVDIAN